MRGLSPCDLEAGWIAGWDVVLAIGSWSFAGVLYKWLNEMYSMTAEACINLHRERSERRDRMGLWFLVC